MHAKTILASLAVASLTIISSQARADAVPLKAGERAHERTFYNYAERNKASYKEENSVAVNPTTPEMDIDQERVRNFYIVPSLGAEVATVGAQLYTNTGAGTTGITVQRQTSNVAFAPAFGVQAGWRLGYFNLGARYQGSVFVDPDYRSLSLNKLYGEVGFNTRYKVMLFSGYLDAGYAFAATSTTFANGVGAKAGVGFDFLINRFFSMGPGFSFDVHAYRPTANDWVAVYGGTAQLRIGFHI